jgi:hypothetical protein
VRVLGRPADSTGHGQSPRERRIATRNQMRVRYEVAQATKRCGLPDTAPLVRCSEVGGDGCWLHRFVQARGVTNVVGGSFAIAVNRRKRRAKSDG